MRNRTLLAMLIGFSMVICGACKAETNKNDVNNNSNTYESSESTEYEAVDFDTYNVLTFEIEEKILPQLNTVVQRVKVKNNGKDVVDSILLDVEFKDENNVKLVDGSGSIHYSIKTNEEAMIMTDGYGEANVDSVKSTEITRYIYTVGDYEYAIYINDKKADKRLITEADQAGKEVDFNKVNILGIKVEPEKQENAPTGDLFTMPITITNTSNLRITNLSVDVALVNDKGVFVDSLSGTANTDDTLGLQKINETDLLSTTLGGYNETITNAIPYKYYYKLSEKDENGFNHYEVYLNTKKAIGSYAEF